MAAEPSDLFQGKIGRTYRDSTPHWPQAQQPGAGAPNIVFIVLDDVGFSDLACFGSEINTPAMDALAAGGLRYNNFHVTSMCSPTRACLLTGRNAHSVGVGIIAEWAGGFPAYEGRMTRRAATVPEVLRDQGYSTYALGKWHLTNMDHYGAAGPHGDWPLGRGFDSWYGFHGGLSDQWNPELYQDNRPIAAPSKPGYHLSEDLVDQAIGRLRDHVTSAPARPFMLYLAFGACHWPHHVPREYIDRYLGRYDAGWDVIRKERQQRQQSLGIVPPGALLAPRDPAVHAWEDLPAPVRLLSTRLQETYAGFLEHTDAQIARLVDHLKYTGQFDNTLMVLISDNGASPEGGQFGSFNLLPSMQEAQSPDEGLANLDKIGSEHAFNHYPTGWAQVSNTPLKWYKKQTHGGGVRAPLIMHWPNRIKASGEIRSQYQHVIDIAPTLYEAIGVEAPMHFQGIPQLPIHGTSLIHTFDDSAAPTRKTTQYFELLGARALWHRGWKAVARHFKGTDFESDKWELYHLDADYSEAHDLAASLPAKLQELVKLWWEEAEKYGVFPLDDREWERAVERVKPNAGTTRYSFYPGMARLSHLIGPNISNRSYTISAELSIPPQGAEGVLLAWGSRFGGLSIYLKHGRACVEYVYSDTIRHSLQSPDALPAGQHEVSLRFKRGSKSAGQAELLIDGLCTAQVYIPNSWPTGGLVQGITCGANSGPPITDSYLRPFPFTGTLQRVTVELGSDGERAPQEILKTLLREE